MAQDADSPGNEPPPPPPRLGDAGESPAVEQHRRPLVSPRVRPSIGGGTAVSPVSGATEARVPVSPANASSQVSPVGYGGGSSVSPEASPISGGAASNQRCEMMNFLAIFSSFFLLHKGRHYRAKGTFNLLSRVALYCCCCDAFSVLQGRDHCVCSIWWLIFADKCPCDIKCHMNVYLCCVSS